MSSGITYSNFQTDLNAIITGSATSVGQLVGADSSGTTFYGSYPNTLYSTQNSGSYTYSKTHSVQGTLSHYFRLGWNSGTSSLSSISLAQSYTSGTDTLVNSYSYSLPTALTVQGGTTVDIIVNSTNFMLACPALGVGIGIFDLGSSGYIRAYPNSMQMAFVPIIAGNPNIIIPYTYNFLTLSYGTVTNATFTYVNPNRVTYNSAGNTAVLENPVFVQHNAAGGSVCGIYGLNKIYDTIYGNRAIYQDSSNVYRLVITTDTVAYSCTIT